MTPSRLPYAEGATPHELAVDGAAVGRSLPVPEPRTPQTAWADAAGSPGVPPVSDRLAALAGRLDLPEA